MLYSRCCILHGSVPYDSRFISVSSLVLELWQFLFIRDWSDIRKSETSLSEFCSYTRVTAFTVSELLKLMFTLIFNFAKIFCQSYFSKYWSFTNFWGKFHPKICCSPCLLKFSIEIQWTYISQNKLKEASHGCNNVLVNESVLIILVLHINRF